MQSIDPLFRVEVLGQTPNPQSVIYNALHTDYSEDFVMESSPVTPGETACGQIAVKRLLQGGRGHWGPLEHVHIAFAAGYFPHSVMQQARTHRIASFDVQSGRYTGQRIIDCTWGKRTVEEVFYLRPVGPYKDREGNTYEYTQAWRDKDALICKASAHQYAQDTEEGMSPEHARGKVAFDFRQHFVFSGNLRAIAHFLSVRSKPDAQLEIQQLCQLMLPHLQSWCPEIFAWIEENQIKKGRLAP